jgi:hypothetical protein
LASSSGDGHGSGALTRMTEIAARAIGVGIQMDWLLKMGLATAFGSSQFLRIASVTLAATSVTLALLLGVLR